MPDWSKSPSSVSLVNPGKLLSIAVTFDSMRDLVHVKYLFMAISVKVH